jgi:serine/threonine protein kinase
MLPQSQREREQHLDEVLAGYLSALKEGSAPDRQELLDKHAELAGDLSAFFADQDHFDRLAAPLRNLLPARPGKIRDFGDYEVLEEVARGGMGVVYKAWQKSLGRVVALKKLLAGPWASAADLQRFRAEAGAAAHLDHPNILPIYEVGAHAGHPYLCMKFVEGGSLAHRLTTADRRPPARETAHLLATLADAVHYAHQRGILHRDLKPANILLDGQKSEDRTRDENPFRVPIIADFGVAKRAARSDFLETPTSDGGRSLPPTMPQVRTHTGALVGTPSYMAPEQASGSRDGVTTAADVYGLGAILYEMLTGRPPFKGTTPLETVRQVLEREPTRPAAVNPSVDRDLETICLKCLHKEPAGRYASAREMADDLRRFLGGEPILARPVGPLARTWRRARRHPAIAALALALVLALLGGTTAVTVLWLRAERHSRTAEEERDKARSALEQAEQSRREAEEHLEDAEHSFRLAHQAVNDYCRRVSDELQDAPYLQKLRRSLLADALVYYKSFLLRRGNDPALRRELADTHVRMARLSMSLGSRSDARDAFQNAIKLYGELRQADPDKLEIQSKLGDALNGIAILENSTDAALTRFREAHTAYLDFLKTHPQDPLLRAGLAVTLSNMGLACQRTGRHAEAADCFREALALQEKLLEEKPNQEGLQADLASTLVNYSVLRNREPEGREDALRASRRVLDLRAGLAGKNPRNPQRQADLATAHQHLGILLGEAGRRGEALEEFQQAHRIREKLAGENPLVPRYQADLASSCTDLGFNHSSQNRKEQALVYYQKARDIQEKLFRLDPAAPIPRREFALSCFRIGTVQGALKRRTEEYQALKQARELQEALVKSDPGTLDYRRDLARTLNNLGWNRLAQNHADEALPLLRESIGHVRLALDRAPQVAAYRETLSTNYGSLAEVELRLGHTRAAADAWSDCAKLWPDNPGELYRVARGLALVAARVGRDKTQLTPDEEAERRQDLDRALTLIRQAVAHGFRDVARLQQDKALEPLRSDEGLRDLIRELEKKGR